MTLLMSVKNKNKEYDLELEMQSKTGATCTVNPANKFCPYAEFKKSIQKGSTGYEWIDVQRLTESKYLLFTKEDFGTYGTCASAATSQLRYKTHSTFNSFFSEEAKHKQSTTMNAGITSQKPFWALYCFTGFGNKSIKHVNLVLESKPDLNKLCDPLYPAGSEYSMDKLALANAAN